MCRVGFPGKPDSLSHDNENVLCCATFLPQSGDKLLCYHGEAIFSTTWSPSFFLRSLQYGIVVMGVIDAFAYAHNHHRRNMDNPGNFGDCMKGRIRFKTAITPANAHTYQLTYLTKHIPVVLSQKFRLPLPKPYTQVTQCSHHNTREQAMITEVGIPTLTECTRFAAGETFAGWGAEYDRSTLFPWAFWHGSP